VKPPLTLGGRRSKPIDFFIHSKTAASTAVFLFAEL